jgi:HlyD family secretion protein
MPSQLFPLEIIEYSAEAYYSKLRVGSRIIYVIVTLAIAITIASLPFIYVDVSTQARGIIRTEAENTIIQSSVYGEVAKYNLFENKNVTTGDTLIVFDTAQIDEQIRHNAAQQSQNESFISDLTLLLNGQKPKTARYIAEYSRFRAKSNDQQIQIDFLKKDHDVNKSLYSRGVITEYEYLTQKNNLEKAESLLENVKEEFRVSWQAEKTEFELQNQTLMSNILQLGKNLRNYILTAPTTGTLVQVAGFRTGNFIAPNQPIAYISSSDSLLAECYLSPSDIGYIYENQDVFFQTDAFDYREWGLLNGKVVAILKDVVSVSDQPMFRVRCNLNSNCLHLGNGCRGCLQKGMSFTARFHLTRRSLWQLLFDKADDWLNPKIMSE